MSENDPLIDRRTCLKAAAPLLVGAITAAEAGAMAQSTRPAGGDFRSRLLECLGGPWPERNRVEDLSVRAEAEPVKKDGYTLEQVSFASVGDPLEPGDRILAYVLIPDGVSAKKPAPAVAVWHQHNGAWHIGASEPAGLAGSPMHQTGVALAREGYVVVCPDALCFGKRQDPAGKLKRGDYERWQFLRYTVAGKCLAWKDILDMKRTVDYLAARPEVNADRIGCYGHSMGSTHTWMVGPWEPRLRCLVGNCCLPTYKAIEQYKLLHCFENFVPGLAQYGDTPDIAGLIAPRRLHLNFGEKDGGSPIEEVRRAIPVISAAYAAAGAKDRFTWFIEDGAGHVLSEAMWARAKECFALELKT
jgi:dienelactone hydrolase